MKHTFFALLVATTFLTPVQAAEIDAASRIDAVTVYPQGAEITRVATVDIAAGDHTLVLDNLPADIDTQSIRVEGSAGSPVEIGSVDTKRVHLTDDAELAGLRKQIEDEIETLRDQKAALDQLIRNVGLQQQLIQDLASKPFTTKTSSETHLTLDSAELASLFDLVANRMQALDKRALEARIETRKIDEKISDLQKRLSELAPKQSTKAIVTVDLSSEAPTSGTFRIKYRIHNAGWRPYYDARLNVPQTGHEPELSLVRRAEIVQSTTESWSNVALTLSTARPAGATAAPELQAMTLHLWDKERRQAHKFGALQRKADANAPGLQGMLAQSSVVEEDRAARPREAQITTAGFQALYAIPGRVSVDNSGTAKKVQIATETLSTSLSVHAVPVLDPTAYLTAKFTVNGETPLLPGRVLLFRDNVYMGNGTLPLLSPGEDHSLGFGADDRVKVKRTEVHRETSESGIISTDIVEESSWLIEVENLHGRTMPVKIYDRMPYATHEDINVKLLAGTTPPTDDNVENKRGVLAWDYVMTEGAKKTIKFGYSIASPKDKQIQVGMR